MMELISLGDFPFSLLIDSASRGKAGERSQFGGTNSHRTRPQFQWLCFATGMPCGPVNLRVPQPEELPFSKLNIKLHVCFPLAFSKHFDIYLLNPILQVRKWSPQGVGLKQNTNILKSLLENSSLGHFDLFFHIRSH